MVRVFLTDEAEDYLLDKFVENGLPQMPDAEWTSEIRLDYVDSGVTVQSLKIEKLEGYSKATHFFPPTLEKQELEKAEIDEDALNDCRTCLEQFLAGEKEIKGIPTDEDLSWLRHSILFRRLVAPYVREHIVSREYSPDDLLAGVFLSIEDEKLKDEIVRGKQRPDLTYGQIDPETGELVEKQGRFYADEMNDGEGFSRVMQELENRPKYMVVPDESGEKVELPAPFLRAYQSSRLWLDGQHRRKELSSRTTPVEFKQDGFLFQKNLNKNAERIYISVDTLMQLPDPEVAFNRIPEELLPETVIEITDSDYICVAEVTGTIKVNTQLSLYTRFGVPLMSPIRAQAGNVGMGSGLLLGDGLIGGDGEGYLEDVVYSLLFGYRKVIAVLIAANWFSKHGRTNSPQSGLLIEADKDRIYVRQVCGKERPDLICDAGEGKTALWRPYQPDDDFNLPEVMESVTYDELLAAFATPDEKSGSMQQEDEIEKLEQLAAQGAPDAMKLLASKYANGDGVARNPEKALSLYEKALALLPDDKDLEFEIFMLKMDID